MVITHGEVNLRLLVKLLLVLFGGAVIALTTAAWNPGTLALYSDNPYLIFAWLGQLTLFCCALYLLSGIRDNEIVAQGIGWYMLVSGTVMVVYALMHSPAVLGGAIVAYAIGGATIYTWMRARQSRKLRLPHWSPPKTTNTPATLPLRILMGVFAAAVLVIGIALAVNQFRSAPPAAWVYEHGLISANAIAVYATLAWLGWMAAKAPRRHLFAYDIIHIMNVMALIGLGFWLTRFPVEQALNTLFTLAAVFHALFAIVMRVANMRAAAAERPTRFLGAWLHHVFEAFSDITIKGSYEAMTARELADAADDLLAKIEGHACRDSSWRSS